MTASRPMDVDRRHSQQSFASSAKVDSVFIFSLLSERQMPGAAPAPRFYKVEKHGPSRGRGYRQAAPNVSFGLGVSRADRPSPAGVQQLVPASRRRRRDLEVRAGGAGDEQFGGVQVDPVAAEAGHALVALAVPVAVVTDDGMARMAEMDPDLMFASRQQPNADEGGPLPEPSFDPDSGFGSLAVRVDDHAGFLAAQRRIQDLRVRRPGSGDDGQIVALDLVLPLAQEFVEVTQHRRGLRQ